MPQDPKKRRENTDKPIAEIIRAWMGEYRHEGKFDQSRLRTVWNQKMGTSIAKYTRNLVLVKGTLYLSIDSAPLRDQLSFQKEQIRTMLNREIGKDAVKQVVVR